MSVVILTLNEELNLPGAILSVLPHCDDVVVFDSFSTDRTCLIAQEFGARVYQRTFDNYAAQRNAALNTVHYAYPWVLMLDADERATAELLRELSDTLPALDKSVSLLRFRRKDYFFGRWLRRSSGYPTWFGRIARIGNVAVTREINEEYVTSGNVHHLREHIIHFPFARGISHWISRHNEYSTAEARLLVANSGASGPRWRDLLGDPVTRRRALKQLAYRLPLRPMLVFIYLYLARGGILDGLAGYRFCKLRSFYEHMIDLKVAEIQQKNVGL